MYYCNKFRELQMSMGSLKSNINISFVVIKVSSNVDGFILKHPV